MDKKELAVQYKHSGYNCAQAVISAYADELGIDLETARALGAGFGAGMGTMGATCGALCGAQIGGAAICIDLKGVTTGRMLCSCDDCVANAVEIVGGLL